MEGYKRDSYGKKKRINVGNVIGDPFALATISIGMVSLGKAADTLAVITNAPYRLLGSSPL